MKIVHSFNPKIPSNSSINLVGSTNFCSWNRLKNHLAAAAGCSSSEEVVGFSADQDGVTIVIKKK